MSRYRVSVRLDSQDREVVVDLDPEATGEDLAVLLREWLGVDDPLWCDESRISGPQPVDAVGLTNGAVVRIQRHPPDGAVGPGVYLVVVGGPAGGQMIALEENRRCTVGRSGADFVVDDPLLSRPHAEFTLIGDTVAVKDLGSKNGTTVEGRLIARDGTAPVDLGNFVAMGSTVLAAVRVEPADVVQLGAPSGATYPFPRTFREALPVLESSIRWPSRPRTSDASDGGGLLRSLLPMLTMSGFLLYRVSPWFILVGLTGPAYSAWDLTRRRRRNRKRAAADEAEYRRSVEEARGRIAEIRREERRRRRVARPLGGLAVLMAAARHRRLWERRPNDEDFLVVPVGLAVLDSEVTVQEPGGSSPSDDDPRIWGLPLDVNLGGTGSISVIGPDARARAVVRNMLLTLAVTHSPSELSFWLFAGAGEDKCDASKEWGLSRWLPHFFVDEFANRVACTPGARSELWGLLKQELDGRTAADTGDRRTLRLPVQIVVIEGSGLLPETDVAELLDRGHALGIIGVIIDDSRSPEGVQGVLALGAAADEATYESRDQARVEGVLTAEIASDVAEAASRRMAALSPSVTGPRTLSAHSARLVGLLGSSVSTPEAIAQRWADQGPSTRVVVGAAADADFFVDVVQNGPHGLIGGATRSGKTEFLKTLIMSLAATNHPDDLTFVIVDFKGGIDYGLVGRLPHVLEVTSNKDIDRFERTITMLTAELERRQGIFGGAEVVNLDAYRAAREQNPSLPAVPRMVVLIDEFGELYSSDVGRLHLKKLESITRIGAGLGMNLILVTQNFEGQLPDQIAANTGLRVCFRVQESGHSKVLLGVGIAADLDPSLIGRGYAQFKGKTPAQFQSARIAGRRADLTDVRALSSVYDRPFAALPYTIAPPDEVDPPDEDTDMYRLVEDIHRASGMVGWTGSPVPWPEPLGGNVDLVLAFEGDRDGSAIPFAILDVPREQRRRPFSLRFGDGHVLVLGGPRANLQQALVTLATSAALRCAPDEMHLYVIDESGRSLDRLARLPHCGGVASRNTGLALRILAFLSDEVARRRALVSRAGATTVAEAFRGGAPPPHIVLFVVAADRLLPSANSGSVSPTMDRLVALAAEGADLGVQIVLTGSPALANHRISTLATKRLLFRTADRGEGLGMGIPRGLINELDEPLKFVDSETELVGSVCMFAQDGVSEMDVFDVLATRLDQEYPAGSSDQVPRVLREVAWPVTIEEVKSVATTPPPHMVNPLLIGLEALSSEGLFIDAMDDGPTFAVCGERMSGRTNALQLIGRTAAEQGWTVISTAFSRVSPMRKSTEWWTAFDPSQPIELPNPSNGRLLLLVDDFQRPMPTTFSIADASKLALVVVAGTAGSIENRSPWRDIGISAPRNGIVLAPKGFYDFAAFTGVQRDAVRAEFIVGSRAGCGLLVLDGQLVQVVVPLWKSD